MRLFLIVVLLAAGVAHAQKPELPPGDVARWLTFFDKLVATVVTDRENCDKMAADVSALIDANRDAIAVAQHARDTGERLPETAQQHMLDGIDKMVPGMQTCGYSSKVIAAFKKLELSR